MIPLFESQTGWVASGLPVPAVVKDHPSGFWVFAPGGKDRYSPEHFSTFLDLSPLQKFMGRPRKWFVSFFGVSPKMYGMDYDFDWVPPAPSPEKSPQEKALEDFIAKRKAKREVVKPSGNVICNGPGVPDPTYHKDMWHLDRAMRRLSFHEQDIHTRLMPYRREE